MDCDKRQRLITTLHQALEPRPDVYALWQGGAAAFDRVDEWSDIDLIADVEDEQVNAVFEAIEEALLSIAPIKLRYEFPKPTWHGLDQRFYQLEGFGSFMKLDLALVKHSQQNKFIQSEVHGHPIVYFDKRQVTDNPPFDRPALDERLRKRRQELATRFELFQMLTLKELKRSQWVEALAFYQSYTLRPLVELLRITHKPERWDFHTRYLYHDLPEDTVKRLETLFFVKDPEDLQAKHADAGVWFRELHRQLSEKESR